MNSKVIFHLNVNNAFLSWEAEYRIKYMGSTVDLRNIASAVSTDIINRHGIIVERSIPAQQYKIQAGESVLEALKKCRNLVLVPPNYSLYEKNAKAFIDLLKEYFSCVEQYSMEEAFVDMSETEALYCDPVVTANFLKDRIYEELGFSVNVGISNYKLLAKMASDFTKPNQVHTLFQEEIKSKLWTLPVGDLFFIGRAVERKLFALGICTIGQLANSDIEQLKFHFNNYGKVLWNFANGIEGG